MTYSAALCVWSCILYLRFDSKNCPKCHSVVVLQGCRSLQGEGNFFCKRGRVLACVANCPGSGVTACYRPTLRFPCPHTCFLSQLTQWKQKLWYDSTLDRTFGKSLSAILRPPWHRMKAESCSHGWDKFVENISSVNFVLAGLMPDQVSSCSLHANFMLDQLPSVLLQLP